MMKIGQEGVEGGESVIARVVTRGTVLVRGREEDWMGRQIIEKVITDQGREKEDVPWKDTEIEIESGIGIMVTEEEMVVCETEGDGKAAIGRGIIRGKKNGPEDEGAITIFVSNKKTKKKTKTRG